MNYSLMSKQELLEQKEKLCAEYSCAGYSSENADIEHEHKLIDNGNSGHLLCADLSYHNIIKKAYEAGNSILYDHRYCKIQYSSVKGSVAYKCISEFSKHADLTSLRYNAILYHQIIQISRECTVFH